jgi:hypothetical protein
MTTPLEEALATIEAADPAELLKAEMHRAVRDVDFRQEVARKPPGPSMAGQSPVNANLIEQQLRSHAAMVERDRRSSEGRATSREQQVKVLSAGQAPGAEAAVRATLANGG